MRTLWLRPVVLALIASLALPSLAGAEGEPPTADVRVRGEITAVDVGAMAFEVHTARGEDLTFVVTEETRFASPGGELDGIEDLKAGLLVAVAADKQADGTLVALGVAVAHKEDALRVLGEITGVESGRGTFSLETQEGASYAFQTGDRTRFVSRNGSVEVIHDLKKGMHAAVTAIRREDGAWFALRVAVGGPKDRPAIDVRAAGKITEIGSSSFSLEARDGRLLRFGVDDATRFRSRDGSVDAFDDLEVGMMAVVAAKDEAGTLTALWVGVGKPPAERETDEVPGRGA